MQARLTLKIQFEKDLRRISVDSKITWQSLESLLKTVFKSVTESQWTNIAVRYADDEGDMCTISSDEELQEALSLSFAIDSNRPLLKLVLVEEKPQTPEKQESPVARPPNALHALSSFLSKRAAAAATAESPAPAKPEGCRGSGHWQGHALGKEGIALMDAKDYEGARAKFVEQLGVIRPWHKSNPLYNIACCDALLGNSDSALAFLTQAVEAGFRDSEHMKNDEDLTSLRELEQFQLLVLKAAENSQQPRCPWANRGGNFQKGPWFALQQQAISLMESGTKEAIEQARELFNQQNQLSANPWIQRIPLYNIACCEALLGRVEEALKYLKEAVNAGYRNLRHIENDSDLECLRSMPEYQEILSSIKSGHRGRRWCGRRREQQEAAPEEPKEEEKQPEPQEEVPAPPEEKPEPVPVAEKPFFEEIFGLPVAEEVQEFAEEFGKFKTQLEVFAAMGFVDLKENVKALLASHGDLNTALEKLLG
jgi:tetratricopeptide (TPR) repeat protein